MGWFGNSGKWLDKNHRPSIEIVAMTGVSIDSDYVYYLGDDGNVWRKRIGTGEHQMVCSAGVSKEDGYLYFIDTKGGNVCRIHQSGNFDGLDDLENKSLSKTNPLPTSEEIEKSRIDRAILIAKEREEYYDYDGAIEIWEELGEIKEAIRVKKLIANTRESALDYNAAIEIWEELGEIKEAARVRKMKAELGSVKVAQNVVHGDTIVKDSVVNKSNIATGGKSKAEELREAKALLDDGIIDDDEFKQMKKEILGK
jgi:tetratricopeptide (TPR) repeat protein